ncbi:MAG: mechanosensitive ion channel family protein [Vicinamibacterales bacterium]
MLGQLEALLDPGDIQAAVLVAIPRVLAAIVVLLVFWGLKRVTQPALQAALRRGGLDEALVRLLARNVYGGALMVVGIVMAAGQLGINVTAALASIGVAGIAVGFAAQDSLANMIAGFTVFWDKPFRVGDVVEVADEYGKVVEITLRSTRIRTLDNTYVVIPNKTIIDSVLVNHSKHGEMRVNVPIDIAYKEFIPKAREVLLAAAAGVPGVMTDPAPDVIVKELAGSGVSLQVRVWVRDAERAKPVFFAVLEASKLACDAAGIQIPFPHLQLFVENVEQRVLDHTEAVASRLIGRGGASRN